MQNKNKKKICLVVSSLGKGGAEKSAAIISTLLHDLGHEIHVVSILNDIQYEYKGTLLNLGLLKESSGSFFGRINRLKAFVRYLKSNNVEYIIDNRSRPKVLKELIIYKCIFRKYKVFSMVHSFNLKAYLPKNTFIAKLIYSSVIQFIAVSKEIKKELRNKHGIINVTHIYNAVDSNYNKTKSLDFNSIDYPYILFYGRLDNDVKNLDLLLHAYKLSVLPLNKVKLVILGKGKDSDYLKNEVVKFELQDMVKFIAYSSNPFPYIKNAKFVTLTSKHEGFPMVIPEALSLGVPVVSVDCKSGPKEIINDKQNGLLVQNNNPEALAEAMNTFITDHELYKHCKNNAKKSVEHLSLPEISKHWSKIFTQ